MYQQFRYIRFGPARSNSRAFSRISAAVVGLRKCLSAISMVLARWPGRVLTLSIGNEPSCESFTRSAREKKSARELSRAANRTKSIYRQIGAAGSVGATKSDSSTMALLLRSNVNVGFGISEMVVAVARSR